MVGFTVAHEYPGLLVLGFAGALLAHLWLVFFAISVGNRIFRRGEIPFSDQHLRSAPSNLGDRRPISLRFSASRRQALPTASFGEWPNRGRSRRSWLVDVSGTMPKDA